MTLVRELWWYLREVSGESAYDKYLARVRRDRPGEPVMCRRDFERHRADKRGHDPGARCC
jgi:uncharacterized short protein YbdD (DUF466 family)